MIPEPQWTPNNHDYHADRSRWSSSMLKQFREDPGLARWRFVDDKPHKSDGASDAMLLGSAVGLLVGEPDNVSRDLVVVNVESRRAKAYKEAERSYGRTRVVLTAPLAEQAENITDSILEPRTDGARLARALMTQGEGYAEWASRWEDSLGVPCKQKLDRLTEVRGRTTIVELKTAYDTSRRGLWRACKYNGYFRQAAFNIRGVEESTGVRPDFWFVFIKNEAPYGASAFRVAEARIAEAEAEVESDLIKLERALGDERFFAYPHEILEGGEVPVLD